MAWSRYVGIGVESVYGTPVAYTKYAPLINHSPSQNNNVIEADSGESQYIIKDRLGRYSTEGTFELYIEPENIGLLLKTILPTATVADQSGTTKLHTFKPSLTTYPIYTAGFGTDVTAGEHKVTSAVTTKLNIKATADQLHTALFSYVGQKDGAVALSTPTFSTPEPFAFHESPVEIATAADANIEAISIDIEKDRFMNTPTLGTRFQTRAGNTGRFKVSLSVDLAFESLTQWKRFYDGTTGVAPDTQTYTRHAIELLTTGVGTGDTTDKYKFNVIVPAVTFDTRKCSPSKADRTLENVTFKGIYNVAQTSPVYIELQNQVASY